MGDNKRAKLGRNLAKVLGIELDDRNETSVPISRGESVYSVENATEYYEPEPTAADYFRSIIPDRSFFWIYFVRLFPFLQWIGHYNMQWLAGDLVAGITVGCVVVPQSMAYASLAELDPEFGLYSSFMGVLIYWFFATSKDITIGPVAVMSVLTGNVVAKVTEERPDIAPFAVASALAVICGVIIIFLGLIRVGWIVDFIPLTSICAFMTGSSITICAGQVPNLLGISGLNTRRAAYLVIIDTLRALPRARLDAAMGLTALAMLYLIRSVCKFLARKFPHQRKTWFFVSTLRTAFVILLYTLISFLVNRGLDGQNEDNARFKILGYVPRGFQHVGVPPVNREIISLFASELPASVIVLLIEHISISKSFGRINNYTIDPSQEMVAIGITNLFGPFLGGYPATGSFSRTAIKSTAGVRTPFAGVITGVLVLLAIYALPAVFFYIPSASLAGVIIHAVGDLITPPNTVYQFWKISPIEVVIFFAGVLVTIFSDIESGIYTTVAVTAALLLFRVVKAKGRFLGRVKVHSVIGDHVLEGNDNNPDRKAGSAGDSTRNIFLPIHAEDGSNPAIAPQHPYPGIFIYRFSEGYNYPNANHYLDFLIEEVQKITRPTTLKTTTRPGDRPWNDPGPKKNAAPALDDPRPTLKAIILDFSSVNNVDVTSIQHLIDVRNQLDRRTAPEKVQWHFACITNRWTKRALVSAGFGFPPPSSASSDPDAFHRWKPIFSVADLGGTDSAAAAADRAQTQHSLLSRRRDVESAPHNDDDDDKSRFFPTTDIDSIHTNEMDGIEKQLARFDPASSRDGNPIALVHSLNRPFFHIDLTSALQSAIHNTPEWKGRPLPGGGEGKAGNESGGEASSSSPEKRD